MLFYLAWKNVVSKKSSFVIILFIAFAVMMLVTTNAVFDSTENGIKETFISSFTGDIVIRPKNKNPLSLFGDETPVTGKLSKNPTIFPFNDVNDYLTSSPLIEKTVPQLSGRTLICSEFNDKFVYVFGVSPKIYIELMSSIVIEEGSVWDIGEKGALISRKYADLLNVKVGDRVDFLVESGLSSRIRSVLVSGIYHYSVDNEVLDKIVLVNPETVRSLFDISELVSTDSVQLSDDKESFLDVNDDISSLFSDSEDMSDSVTEEEIHYSQSEIEEIQKAYTESSSWNFIICKVADKKQVRKTIKILNKYFKYKDWAVEAIDWRSSAGSTAFYLFILRLILNIGIIIVLFAGFIVINNTLVVNVLDRIREIGTMRAIGASRRYISLECMTETFIMAIIAGAIGCILGIISSNVVSAVHFTFHNSFLIQLFGGETLVTQVNISNITGAFCLSIFIGLIAWIYPVVSALKIHPVQAMQGVK